MLFGFFQIFQSYQFAISIHAPRAGSDQPHNIHRQGETHFNPRSPCGERLVLDRVVELAADISSHAPRAGSDRDLQPVGQRHGISIHAPRAGSDTVESLPAVGTALFQSTLPVRGATLTKIRPSMTFLFQSTLPVRGATPAAQHPRALR